MGREFSNNKFVGSRGLYITSLTTRASGSERSNTAVMVAAWVILIVTGLDGVVTSPVHREKVEPFRGTARSCSADRAFCSGAWTWAPSCSR